MEAIDYKMKDLRDSIESANKEIEYKKDCIERNTANDNRNIVSILKAELGGLKAYKLGLERAYNIMREVY